jgi:hypothetical protein
MPMRCRCPPENSEGYRLVCSGFSPTVSTSSRTRDRSSASLDVRPWMTSGSATMSNTGSRGLSEA